MSISQKNLKLNKARARERRDGLIGGVCTAYIDRFSGVVLGRNTSG